MFSQYDNSWTLTFHNNIVTTHAFVASASCFSRTSRLVVGGGGDEKHHTIIIYMMNIPPNAHPDH